jgi:hypothetical protein
MLMSSAEVPVLFAPGGGTGDLFGRWSRSSISLNMQWRNGTVAASECAACQGCANSPPADECSSAECAQRSTRRSIAQRQYRYNESGYVSLVSCWLGKTSVLSLPRGRRTREMRLWTQAVHRCHQGPRSRDQFALFFVSELREVARSRTTCFDIKEHAEGRSRRSVRSVVSARRALIAGT